MMPVIRMPECQRCKDLDEWREIARSSAEKLHAERAHADRLAEALAFAASAIKSGEPWTQTCEKKIGGALKNYREKK